MDSYRYAIVVGASSGIGLEIVRLLAANGTRVAAVARREDRLETLAAEAPDKILPYVHDVKDYEAIPALFQKITGDLGGLDLIIYSSGVMPEVGPHEYSFDKDREMIEVNVLGGIAWLNQAAVRFENTKSGTIVGIGSVAGERGRQGQPVYNTSKAAIAVYLEALRNRFGKSGVKVTTIKPGPTATEMTTNLKMKKMDAKTVAEITLRKSRRGGEHFVSPVHAVAFLIIRNIPSWLFRKLPI